MTDVLCSYTFGFILGSIVIKFHSWIFVQCKESVDANSGLFKETDDEALNKKSI